MSEDTVPWLSIKGCCACVRALLAAVVLLTEIAGQPGQYQVLLPFVPGTSDYLGDIRVLPDGHDVMNVTIVAPTSDSPGVMCTVNKDTGFQLIEGNCSLPSLLPGLVLITNVRATVIVYDGENSLVLPLTDDLDTTYSLITKSPDENNGTLPSYFVYPSVQNMSLRLCHKQSDRAYDQMNMSDLLTPHGVPAATNCSLIHLTDYKGWILNNVSLSQGMEISSDFPFGVLEWYNVSALPWRKWRQKCSCSQRQLQEPAITWSPFPPVGTRGRQFLVPPSRGSNVSRMLHFIGDTQTMDISVSQENGNVDTFNYGERDTLEAPGGAWLLLNSTQTMLVRHVLQHEETSPCWTRTYLSPIDALSFSDNTVTPSSKWIYIPCHNNISVICNPKGNLPSLFDAERNNQLPFAFNASIFGYTLTSYSLPAGLYSIQLDGQCLLIESRSIMPSLKERSNVASPAHQQMLNVTSNVDHLIEVKPSVNNDSYSQSATGNRSRTLHTDAETSNTTHDGTLKTEPTFFQSIIESTSRITEIHTANLPLKGIIEKRVDRPSTTPIASVNVSSSHNKAEVPVYDRNRSVINFLRAQNEHRQSVLKKNSSPVSVFSNQTGDAMTRQFFTTSVTGSVTQPNLPVRVKQMDISNKNTAVDKADNLISNERFKAVVDIIQSGNKHISDDVFHKEGHILVNGKTNPGYTHRSESSDSLAEITSDKSLMAIIISLCTALVAVVGIILIFLLIEFFSRKRHIRKTRIRPFVSYY